tara:strand:+ start:2264 stop:3307 length:1044 start_codon:yes stop_codon:yes gene_type:complete
MPEGKTVVTQETIPVTVEDSAPQEEVNISAVENDAAEMGSTLPISDDISPGDLDWSEMVPLSEFDQIAAQRGVGPQEHEEIAEEPAPVQQQEEGLTDGMSKRIAKLKQQEQSKIAGKDQELAEKDAIIAAREQQINQLQQMTQEYQNLQSSYVPPQGDVVELDDQISAMDRQLQDEGDTFTAAEVAQHVQKRQDLLSQRSEVASSQANAQQLVQKQQAMRQQSDQYVRENYEFINDPKSEYYTTLKSQAYPMLENIIGPNFKNHPQDMVIAAELSKLMVDANKYQQLLGNRPAPRQEAAPMAGNVTPQSQPNQTRQPSFREAAGNIRGGDLQNFAKLLGDRGHKWRP